jgi:hypothetical protein
MVSPWVGATTIQHLIYNNTTFPAKAASAVNVAIRPTREMLFIDPALFFQPTWEASHGLLGFITIFIQFPHSNSRHSCSINAKHFTSPEGSWCPVSFSAHWDRFLHVQSIAAPARQEWDDLVSIRHRFDANPAPQASWASRSIADPRPMHRSCTSAGPPHLRSWLGRADETKWERP